MLNVLDEKWKDHLYDLDQLRNAIHYRSWGQKDPLIEYKQEAYTMFVDLMSDIAQHVHRAIPQGAAACSSRRRPSDGAAAAARPTPPVRAAPTRRYNALGVLEDVVPARTGGERRRAEAMDIGPAETPPEKPRRGATGPGRSSARVGRAALSDATAARPRPVDWSNVGRNDPCPCGSGKKFKKCHGATL